MTAVSDTPQCKNKYANPASETQWRGFNPTIPMKRKLQGINIWRRNNRVYIRIGEEYLGSVRTHPVFRQIDQAKMLAKIADDKHRDHVREKLALIEYVPGRRNNKNRGMGIPK